METLEMVFFYTLYNIVALGVLLGMPYLILRMAHRVCRAYVWSRVVALVPACLFFGIAVVFSQISTLWFFLTAPFSLVLEFDAALGTFVYVAVTTVAAAAFWGAAIYGVLALVLLILRKMKR